MSEQLNLGQIITTPQNRDAVHIAVVPVKAAERLKPGQHVCYAHGQIAAGGNPVGVVDPYLTKPVQSGEQCWLFLYPGSITSLRHEWTHPDFPVAEAVTPDVATSEKWLREFADSADCPGYFAVMERATAFCDGDTGWSDEYLHFDGLDAHGEIPAEFWTHFYIVTGKKSERPPTYFSCSC